MLQRMNGTIWLFISVFIRQTEKETQTMSAEYYLYGTIALYICPHKWNRFSVGVGWYLTAFCLHSSSVYLNTIMHAALQKQRLYCVGSESEKKKNYRSISPVQTKALPCKHTVFFSAKIRSRPFLISISLIHFKCDSEVSNNNTPDKIIMLIWKQRIVQWVIQTHSFIVSCYSI